MATTIYDSDYVYLLDGTQLSISPLKIKYLRELMDIFYTVKSTNNDEEAIHVLAQCVLAAMPQYYPSITTIEDLEDAFDLPTIYRILDLAADIKIDTDKDEQVVDQAKDNAITWDTLELDKLESEVFLLGIWKDYEELETSLSMPELMATLSAKRDSDYQEKKFFAALQGVDLDKQSGNRGSANAWEEMKARVFSGGKTSDPNDITALQGVNAQKAGFGIGMGIDYLDLTKK